MSRFNSASMSSTVCDETRGAADGFFGSGLGFGAARLNSDLRSRFRLRRGVLEEIYELFADLVELFPEGFRGGAGGTRGVSRGELLLQVAEKVAKAIKFFLLSRARRARPDDDGDARTTTRAVIERRSSRASTHRSNPSPSRVPGTSPPRRTPRASPGPRARYTPLSPR